MKKIRYILSVLVVLCLLGSMPLTVFAANASLVIDNQTISEITITGDNDGISSKNNSYKITAKAIGSGNILSGYKYTAQTRVLTFENTHRGYVKITYTIDKNGTLTAGDDCTISNGVITMQPHGTFSISVTSPATGKWGNGNTTVCEFKPSAIEKEEMEELSMGITFVSGAVGTYTVTDADGNPVSLGEKVNSASYTLTAGEAPAGYKFLCFMFTDDSTGAKTSFGVNVTGAVTFSNIETPGTVTSVFMPTDAALYTVDGSYFAYLDDAITAARSSSSKKIVLAGTGKVYGSTTDVTEFTIPGGVTLVLPYAAGQEFVQGSSVASNSYYPYGNYTQTSTYHAQPSSLSADRYLELTIPEGTIVNNNGVISVGGTLGGNAAMSGKHSNLVVNGTLNLKSSTSVLSAIGYVYGEGDIVANGSGAKILQPLSLLRSGSWGWSVACTGSTFNGMVALLNPGMGTYPRDGSDGVNPSPRYATQGIQCNFEMQYGDTMYGYADQYCETHYMCTVVLIGSDSSNGLIALKSGATLNTTYASDKKSTLYGNVGKMTLTIDGGATQGNLKLEQNGMAISLNSWPFPVPYNYDLVLVNGIYDLKFDLNLLPGAGLKIGTDATLNIPSGVHLAVFTGANDHSTYGVHQSGGSSSTKNYTEKSSSPNYPANSTLAAPSGGTMMANFIVEGTGVLDVKSGAYFGGVVQTTGGGTVKMNGNTGRFTRQLGVTGQCNDMDGQKWYFAGETIYEFYPQYFDENGTLQTMKSGMIYKGANAEVNSIETFTFDLYTSSADVSQKESHTETINAKPVGRFSSECNHSLNEATCEIPATCTKCGATEGEALGHTPAEAVIENEVVATCTADGSYDTVVYCSVCDAELSRVPTVIPATGHTAGEAVVENEVTATCTADGSYDTVVYCTVCDAELSRVPTTVPATSHTAAEAVVENEVAATCGADGSYDTVVYCSVCNAELSRVTTTVPANGHTEGEVVVEKEVAATCTAEGSYDNVVYCTVCKAELSRETTTVPATGHTEGEAVKENEKAPSYNAAGSHDSVVYCSVCKAELSREAVSVPALTGAEASIGNTKYGTLEEALAIGGEVTLLAHIDADKAFEIKNPVVLDLNGHNISSTEKDTNGDGVFHVIAGGDLTIEGEGVINGASKGNNYSIAIWADGGKVTINGGTYTNVGAGEDNHYDLIYVKNGGEVVINGGTFIAQTPAWTLNSHDTSKGTITVYGGNFHDFNPCNSKTEGVGTNFCADGYCAVEENGYYTVQKHSYESAVTAPTCTAAGYTTYTCVGCNNSYVDNYVDALGHTEAAAVVENEVAATCGTDGSFDNVVYCTVCDAELSRVTTTVDALGHTEETIAGKAATCTEPGLTDGKKCTVCGETTVTQNEIPATGHVNTTATTVAATCTTDGSVTVTCACGEIVKTETIPATGHTAGEAVKENVVDATCTADGSYDSVVKCTTCGTEISRETVPVEALGHNYVDGVCTVCGHTTLAPHIKITTDNMELGNSLALIFWVKKSEVKPDVNYYAVLTRTYADGMIDEVTVPMEEWKEVGNNYQIEYDNFAAKEMTDKISIQIFMSDGSIASNIFTDTIQEYAMYSIDYYKQFKEYSEFVTAMVDMLNYGAAAQIQFGYDTGDLANSKLTDEYQMLGTQSISPEDHWSNPQGKATSSNLELVSNIVLHIWFKEVTSDMYAVVSYTNHYGDLIEDTVLFDEFTDRGNGSYSVPVDELVVADGGQVVTCTLFYGDGSQFACCTESVESYIYIMTSYDLDTTGLYEATMKFVTSSYNYFH